MVVSLRDISLPESLDATGVSTDLAAMHTKPDVTAPVNAYAEAGVVARLGSCDLLWCKITADNKSGWVQRVHLWGLLPGEVRD